MRGVPGRIRSRGAAVTSMRRGAEVPVWGGPRMIAHRFDGYQPAFDYNQMTGLQTGKWQHRRPSIYNRISENVNDTSTNPGYLFSASGEIAGSTADTTAILVQEANDALGAIDGWSWDWYHEESLTDPADNSGDPGQVNAVQVGKLNRGLKAYLASSIVEPKFCVNVLAGNLGLRFPNADPYKYLNAFGDYINGLMADARYLRTRGGRPFLLMYQDGGAGEVMDLTHWNQFLGRLTHGTPYVIQANGQTALATTLGMDSVIWYGPNNLPAGAGRLSFAAQAAKDATRWTAGQAVTVTLVDDARAQELGATAWVDQGTQPEILTHISNANSVSASGGTFIYAHNECAEGGPGMVRTAQERTRYYDMLRWARGWLRPTSYQYEISCATTAGALPGSGVGSGGAGWSTSQPGPTGLLGCHDSDEEISATATDYKEIQHKGVLDLGFYCTTGPDRGIVTMTFDGGGAVDVDLYAATETRHVLVWSHNFGDAGTHTVRATVKGTKNASSSSVQVGLDSFYVNYNPSVVNS